jgi:HK97 family phage major capsid protein
MMVPFATRPIQVTDTIPSTTTGQAAVKYMEETTFTNAAVETDEAGTYQESALALTERTSPVEKIATWLPVTDEQLEDVSQVSGYIDNRLSFMLRQRLDAQILVGDGTAPNLSGILDRVGLQTQAKGADPTPDAVYKAMMLVRVTGRAIPNVVYAHPTDWQDVRLLRTTDGIYIWGSPADPGPDRIWGLPVVLTDAITLNTMLVGDTTFAELAYRRGIDIQQAIRADVRVALQVYRPSAFAQVTGV